MNGVRHQMFLYKFVVPKNSNFNLEVMLDVEI
jgi:hypothetical protein